MLNVNKEKTGNINVYALFDSKALAFQKPIFVLNDQIAVRELKIAVNDKSNMIGMFPEDYTLFRIATFDEKSGNIEKLKTQQAVVSCKELVDVQLQNVLSNGNKQTHTRETQGETVSETLKEQAL